MNNQDLSKVLRYIEENIRITEQTTIDYLDPKRHLDRLQSRQNHVVFGRRGSGKSLLLKSLRSSGTDDRNSISINLEDFKDISFPNSISHVLISILKYLKETLKGKYNIWHFKNWSKQREIIKIIDNQISQLEKKISEPDTYNEKIREKSASKISGKLSSGVGKSQAEIGSEMADELETSREILKDKLNELKNEISNFKSLINSICEFTNKDIYLILDDLYFIRKNEQPFFIDFFHRISKNTSLYLKIATIKQRSSLYLQTDTFVGIEIGHDVQELSLDYTLQDFNNLVAFMKQLLNHINQKVGVNIDYDNVLTDNAFRFLCLASGGVPRDFLTLFISLGEKMINGNRNISKPNVIECSIENLPNKMEAFNMDSAEEKTVLENYLQYIRKEIINNRKWNAFLVSNSDIENYPKIKEAIKELVDLRLIHLVNPNTSSAPSDGTRYSAYMVDIGLFPNSNPRQFTQIEPGQKDESGREDKLRSAPKINLSDYENYIKSQNLASDIQIYN
ncbi:hypothetical protein LPB85_17105 [Chryseobacterium sp. LC2016-27]|uniref:ORC-CDC6 family AAA ATPase n=1 Tax=Chryseobacterium sp. LC2016-27 TaxID=2897326 RepID=UPI001E5F3327|nr:hypothetical protein [Chryseobacterium sp. LC2016-27]MCD0457172.1 hypothetical protein [Chryseobacterium sp. LC2016-27]